MHPAVLLIFWGLGVRQRPQEEKTMGNGLQGGLAQSCWRHGGSSETVLLLPSTRQSLKEGSQSSFYFHSPPPFAGHCVNWKCHTVQENVASGMRKRNKLEARVYSLLKIGIDLGADTVFHSVKA